jgi:hypothetical protein
LNEPERPAPRDNWRPVLVGALFVDFVVGVYFLWPASFSLIGSAVCMTLFIVLFARLAWYSREGGLDTESWRSDDEKRARDEWRGLVLMAIFLSAGWVAVSLWPTADFTQAGIGTTAFLIMLVRYVWYQRERMG